MPGARRLPPWAVQGSSTVPSTPQVEEEPHGPPEARPGGAVHPVEADIRALTSQTAVEVMVKNPLRPPEGMTTGSPAQPGRTPPEPRGADAVRAARPVSVVAVGALPVQDAKSGEPGEW